MSKKQILKNLKKNNDSKVVEEKDNYFKFVTTLAALLIVLILTYFLVGLFYTKEIDFKKDSDKEEKNEVSVDNSTIMLGQIFEQHEEEYYVIVYALNDKINSISSWLSVYKNSDNALDVYVVDASKKFNSKYLVEKDSNKNAEKVSDLRVKSPTLIKISNGKITEYVEGEEEIVNILKK